MVVKFDLISGLISGGHIRPGPDMAGYENLAGFRPGPGPDMISGATLHYTDYTIGKVVVSWLKILAANLTLRF